METTLPQRIAPSALGLATGPQPPPFAQQTVTLTKQASSDLRWQAHSWQAQYQRLVERETALKAQIAAHHATIRDLTPRLYGTKGEKAAPSPETGTSKPASPRKRG